jgi:hypothetical protein
MERMTKEQIGKLVRRIIHANTGRSPKSMHLDSRLYYHDAEGVYPKNYSGKSLRINIGKLEHIILDLESELKTDFNIPGEWRDPKSYDNTSIKYHKDTRLHHLIDFVHDKYNKAVTKNKAPDISEATGYNIFNSEGNLDAYYVKIIKEGHNLYVVDNEGTLAWSTNKLDLCFFDSKSINNVFDLSANDVIAAAKPSDLSDFLRKLVVPFELSFIHLKEDPEDNHWTYTEDEQVDTILNKLSPEEADFIRAKLK